MTGSAGQMTHVPDLVQRGKARRERDRSRIGDVDSHVPSKATSEPDTAAIFCEFCAAPAPGASARYAGSNDDRLLL